MAKKSRRKSRAALAKEYRAAKAAYHKAGRALRACKK